MKTVIKILIFISFFISCRDKEVIVKKPIFDLKKKHIGDSIIRNNFVQKIVFHDTAYYVDSIVFTKFEKTDILKSVETFINDRKVFENIEYYENGNISKYLFIDDDSSHFIYERLYHQNGLLKKINGRLFFQVFVDDSTSSKDFDIKKGTKLHYKIYFPSPPDCISKIYIKNDDGTIYDVFKQSPFLPFLKTVYQDNDDIGVFKVNIVLEQKEKSIDTTYLYQKDWIFRVVP